MNSENSILLTGIAIGNETATLTLTPRSCQTDGIDIATSVKVLEYEFSVETFFYGYNLETFLEETNEVVSGGVNRCHLFNYNETLILEFINEGGVTFLSLDYRSVLPQRPDDKILRVLREASKLGSTCNFGSKFSFSFMPLHGGALSDITSSLTEILAQHNISTRSPYP